MTDLIRKCPSCNNELTYKSKDAFNQANKKNSICKSCSTKKQYINDPLKNKGNKNGRYGKSIKQISIDKYGPDIGFQKYEQWSQKLSEHGFQIGELNPSFGKSPSFNSGISYKGWYKKIFFRSTLELCFLLKYEIENGYLPTIADDKKYRLPYTDGYGKIKTYVPDFIDLSLKIIFELKCSAFVLTEINTLKTKAAQKKFGEEGLTYKIITEKDVDNFNCDTFLSKLKYLHDTKIVELTDKSLNKLYKRLKLNKENNMCS